MCNIVCKIIFGNIYITFAMWNVDSESARSTHLFCLLFLSCSSDMEAEEEDSEVYSDSEDMHDEVGQLPEHVVHVYSAL